MSGYAVYVYSAWAIAYLAIGVCIVRERRKLKALLREVSRDQ
ncbi:MAG: heme exporter protein CcmD [Gammaproteobacteria bacterium]